MIRTQILLAEEQARALREIAAAEGRSMADLVREGVDGFLERRGQVDRGTLARRSLELAGTFRSGVTDLGSAHDGYFAETASE
jgi:hypothetical protein